MKKQRFILLSLSIALLCAPAWAQNTTTAQETPPSSEETQSDWEFFAALYLWGSNISGETVGAGDIDYGVSDLLDDLKMTGMGSLGVSYRKLSFIVDAVYLDVEDSSTESLGRLFQRTDAELEAWVVAPVLTYNVIEADHLQLDVLAGARYLDLEMDVEIEGPFRTFNPSGSEAGLDGIVGVRGAVLLNDKFYCPYQFDVGAGDSDLTWQAFGGLGYKLTDHFDLLAGYRYLKWEFDEGEKIGKILNDLDISGFMLGTKFTF